MGSYKSPNMVLITPLITTHEPPSRVKASESRVQVFGVNGLELDKILRPRQT